MFGLDGVSAPLAVGVDIVDSERLHRAVDRWGEPFLARVFTIVERDRLIGARGLRWDSLAGRFAAKEATRKAFGSLGEMPRWTDLQVDVGSHGQPVLTLIGHAAQVAMRCGVLRLHLSIAHERKAAVAIVVAS